MSGEPILVIDDNPQNVKLLVLLLGDEGYEVQTAVDAEHALRVLEGFRPRLILMDVQLPGMDGLELTRHLKAHPLHCSNVIIALTAHAMKGDHERVLEAGCDGYVTKPLDTDALIALVRAHLDR